jgi:putative toxin-antitoxin system antitoxin component (TIGR02293 family)
MKVSYFDKPVVQSFLPEDYEEHRTIVNDIPDGPQTPLVVRVRQGLPMEEFRSLQGLLAIPEEDLGRFLAISPATLGRRKKAGRLEMIESERVVRLARLFGKAYELFESEEAAREWLKTPNPGTAGESPLSYADTEFGAREVENLIGRIEHGVF